MIKNMEPDEYERTMAELEEYESSRKMHMVRALSVSVPYDCHVAPRLAKALHILTKKYTTPLITVDGGADSCVVTSEFNIVAVTGTLCEPCRF